MPNLVPFFPRSFAGDGVLICAGLMTSLYKAAHSNRLFPRLIPGFHRIDLPILLPISKPVFVGLILTSGARPKSASSRFHGLFFD